MCNFLKRIIGQAPELPSPSDILPSDAILAPDANGGIHIDLTKLVIPLTEPPKVYILPVVGTGSMDPVMDADHNTILIRGRSLNDHRSLVDWLFAQPPGNIAVYRRTARLNIIHRVIGKKSDAEGEYLVFRGDNCGAADPDKVRRSMIKYLSIGTLY